MKKFFVLLPIVFSTQSALAFELTPYVGLNAQMRYMPLKKGYGDGNFQSKIPQGEVLGGIKINPYVGFELGYSRSIERHKISTTYAPDQFFGDASYLAGVGFERGSSSCKVDGARLSLVGFLPLNEDMQLFGSVGIARLRVRLKYVPVSTGLAVFRPADAEAFTLDFKKTKYIPQAKVGIQQMLTNSVGLNAFIGWDGTKKFNLLKPKRDNSDSRASLKDSYSIGLGFSYYFN